MHALKDRIDQELPSGGRYAFTFGYAVVFPDCNPSGPPPPGADPAIVFGPKDLSAIDRRIDDIFRKFRGARSMEPLPEPVRQAIQRGLSPVFKLLPLLYRIREQEESLFRMTEEQEHLVDFLGDNDRAAIRGVAGSGKTKLAMASAQWFAEQGKRVLFLCFNRMLADWLKAERPERYDERIG